MHSDGINIIDGETFRAGARRSGSQSLPSPEVGGKEWVVVVAVVCVLGWGHLNAPALTTARLFVFFFSSESFGRGRGRKD